MKSLDPDYKCFSTYGGDCKIPSVPQVEAYAASFEEKIRLMSEKVLGMIEEQETEAKRLEEIAANPAHPQTAKLAKALARRLAEENKLASDSLDEAFDLAREEFAALKKAVVELNKLPRTNHYEEDRFISSVREAFDAFRDKKDARTPVERLVIINGYYSYSISGSGLPATAVSSRKFSENAKEVLFLDEDADVIEHLANPKRPFTRVAKKYPVGTPDAVLKAGTKYNPKTNRFVCAYKRTDLISFETHHETYCPGGTDFLKKEIRKYLAGNKQ
jgi:hypothetical protein